MSTTARKVVPPGGDAYAVVAAVAGALPEGYTVESIDGQIVALPRPRGPHVIAASNLGDEIGPPFKRGRGGPGGWILLDEPECHLSGDRDYVVPDLAGWRRVGLEHDEVPECEHGYFSKAPDWVCEVLSPGRTNADRDRITKRDLYARERVAHYWLIDPERRTLEVHRLEGDAYRMVLTAAGDDVVRAEPYDAIELRLGALWHA